MAPAVVADILVVHPEPSTAAGSGANPSRLARWIHSCERHRPTPNRSRSTSSSPATTPTRSPITARCNSIASSSRIQYRVVSARIAAPPRNARRSSLVILAARRNRTHSAGRETGSFPRCPTPTQLDRIFRTYVWSNGTQADLDEPRILGSALVDRGSECADGRAAAIVGRVRSVTAISPPRGHLPAPRVHRLDHRSRRPPPYRPPRADGTGVDGQDGDAAANDGCRRCGGRCPGRDSSLR